MDVRYGAYNHWLAHRGRQGHEMNRFFASHPPPSISSHPQTVSTSTKEPFMKKLVLLSLFVAVLSSYLAAQLSTATISGTITDATGAVVTKAEITVTQPATGYLRQTVSGSAGDYSLPLLPPGSYEMKVHSPGLLDCPAKRYPAPGRSGRHGEPDPEARWSIGGGRGHGRASHD